MVGQNWKIRQKIYHMMNKLDDLTDNLEIIHLTSEDEVIAKAISYFFEDSKALYYPSKSYCVAIIYAKLLEKHFDADFMSCLNDPELLYNNDEYFKTYDLAPKIYDELLSGISENFIQSDTEGVRKTIHYFNEEFSVLHIA